MSQLTSDDRLEIQEVLYRYCHSLDHGRWAELTALFTEGCRLDLSQVLGVYEGHAGLRQFADTLTAANLFMRHLVTNIVIEGDGQRATVHAYVIAITGPAGTKPQQTTGLYTDELVKHDGRWLLHHRRLTLDVPG
jgi:hypothetical protein